mmetsp:Transcript_778/g.1822  ORF Transcript_778/g.1822 Transcript_778/m.1822 type:complete len:217 (+) Transcript_778:357-1007(+)
MPRVHEHGRLWAPLPLPVLPNHLLRDVPASGRVRGSGPLRHGQRAWVHPGQVRVHQVPAVLEPRPSFGLRSREHGGGAFRRRTVVRGKDHQVRGQDQDVSHQAPRRRVRGGAAAAARRRAPPLLPAASLRSQAASAAAAGRGGRERPHTDHCQEAQAHRHRHRHRPTPQARQPPAAAAGGGTLSGAPHRPHLSALSTSALRLTVGDFRRLQAAAGG